MNSRGAAAFNGSPDSSSSPPLPRPPPPHDHGGHKPVPPVAADGCSDDIPSSAPPIFLHSSTSCGDRGEANGTRADDQPNTNPLQPSSSTSSLYMSVRDQFSPTSSHDLEAAHPHPHPHQQQQAVQTSPIRGDTTLNHQQQQQAVQTSQIRGDTMLNHQQQQQAVQTSPIRGDAMLNLSVQAVVLIIQIRLDSPTTSESPPKAFGISVASFAFGFTSTLIGMFIRGVNAAAASVMEAVGFLSTLFGFFLVIGIYLSHRFGGIIAWPLVVLLFLASAFAYAIFK